MPPQFYKATLPYWKRRWDLSLKQGRAVSCHQKTWILRDVFPAQVTYIFSCADTQSALKSLRELSQGHVASYSSCALGMPWICADFSLSFREPEKAKADSQGKREALNCRCLLWTAALMTFSLFSKLFSELSCFIHPHLCQLGLYYADFTSGYLENKTK